VVPRLSAELDERLPHGDDSVWLIRELSVDLAVAARWSPDRIAESIAQAIAAAVQRVVRGEAAIGVTRLDDGVEHLAMVLRDLTTGAGRRWQHGSLARAWEHPRAEAVAQLLRDAGDDGPRALIRTGSELATRIVRSLDDQAAMDLAQRWSLLPTGPDPAIGSLEPAVRRAIAALPVEFLSDQPRAALLLLVLASEELSDMAGPELAAQLRWAVRALRQVEPNEQRSVADASILPEKTGEAIGDDDQVPRTSGVRRRAAPAGARRETARRLTTHASLFALWRSAQISGALTHARALAGHDAAGSAALARALAAGGGDPALDPAVKALLRMESPVGCPPTPAARLPLAALLQAMTSDDWRRPIVTHAVLELGATGSSPAAVLGDAATGLWLWAWEERPSGREVLARCSPGTAALIDAAHAERLPDGWRSEAAEDGRVWLLPPGAAAPASPAPLQRLPGRLLQDFAALTQGMRLERPADALAWACIAQRVMRDFAARVPGFSHAGVAWHRENLLPSIATVASGRSRDGDELILVVDPPPLAMMLRIAGLVPARYQVAGRPPLWVDLRFARR
jgi:hypothetical protein